MPTELQLIAQRIRDLREILEVTPEEMAEVCHVSAEDYLSYESGTRDFSFSFLNAAARRLGVDITDLLTGEATRLSLYSVVREGKGLPIRRREGFSYQNMAYLFKNRIAEPYIVVSPFLGEIADEDISTSTHKGQEFDMVLEGKLKVIVNGHSEVLESGDLIYYDSSTPHGMTAWGGKECKFLAVVLEQED